MKPVENKLPLGSHRNCIFWLSETKIIPAVVHFTTTCNKFHFVSICTISGCKGIIKSLINLSDESQHSLIGTSQVHYCFFLLFFLFISFFFPYQWDYLLNVVIRSVNNGDMIRPLWMVYLCQRPLMMPNVT